MTAKNLMVKALAGTGKTSTMIWSVGSVPRNVTLSDEQAAIRDWVQSQKIAKFRFLAFNKSIASELERKVPAYCEASTCHSSGLSIIKMNHGRGIKVDTWKYRNIMDRLFGEPKKSGDYVVRNAVSKVIDLARCNMLGHQHNGALQLSTHDVAHLMDAFDVEGDLTVDQMTDFANKSLVVGSVDFKTVDFTDMIWLPVFHKMKASKVDGLIVDECFPAGTKVFTAGGQVPIEYIAEHPEFDWQVLSSIDEGKTLQYSAVTSAYKTPIKTHLVKVKHEKGEIICTANHPFWVEGKGWVAAGLLASGDALFSLRESDGTEGETLLSEMCGDLEAKQQEPVGGKITARKNIQTDERGSEGNSQPYGTSGGKKESICVFESQESQTSNSGRQWQRTKQTANDAVSTISDTPSSLAMEPRVCCVQWSSEKSKRVAYQLQDRHSFNIENDSDRSGRFFSRNVGTEGTRSEKNRTTEIVRVVSVEIYQPGNIGESQSMCGQDNFVYTLSVENGNYFADGLLVKNCQDLNKAQQGLVLMQGHQLICVGDINQAIYGFAGADANSMNTLQETLADRGGVDIMPLTVTRRCGKAIVAEAQGFVPQYKAADTNPEGTVRHISVEATVEELKFFGTTPEEKDTTVMVLCRTNAPLVSLAFKLLRQEVRVIIRGRDIGQGLIKLVEKMAGKSDSIDTMLANLANYEAEEETRINRRYKYGADEKLVALHDKVDCIRILGADCPKVTDLVNKLNRLFQDDLGSAGTIVLSSVHKAKGLEADMVYIFKPNLLPHPKLVDKANGIQEFNLRYVAQTRAINVLTYCIDDEE